MTIRTVANIIIAFLLTLPASAQTNGCCQGASMHETCQYEGYHVAACDWMMLKRQKLGEFALAREIEADGVELDMGPLGNRELFDNQLRNPEQAAKFKHYADSLGVAVPSVAMSGFFAQSLLKRDKANIRALFGDCITTMQMFGARVAFLPLGGSGSNWKYPGMEHDSIVDRLRMIGKMADREGIVVGIRTSLPAEQDIRLLDEIGSPAIKIYYNFQDAADNGWDICQELRMLGKERIAQIHASNTDSVLLKDDPDIDMPAIKKTLDNIGWHGWLVVERSRDVSRVRDVKYNFGNNVAYLKEIFEDKEIK